MENEKTNNPDTAEVQNDTFVEDYNVQEEIKKKAKSVKRTNTVLTIIFFIFIAIIIVSIVFLTKAGVPLF